jgi:DNA polymerase kappa
MADDTDDRRKADSPDQVLDAAEKRRREFERSLAGPSVGKAGLMRDQTGEYD